MQNHSSSRDESIGGKHMNTGKCWIDNLVAAEMSVMIDQTLQ
jgi:hypothetical protein